MIMTMKLKYIAPSLSTENSELMTSILAGSNPSLSIGNDNVDAEEIEVKGNDWDIWDEN